MVREMVWYSARGIWWGIRAAAAERGVVRRRRVGMVVCGENIFVREW